MGSLIQNQIEYINKSKKISKVNKELILKFHKKCLAEDLSEKRITKLLCYLRKMGEMIDFDFETATRDQIEGLVADINQSDHANWTKADMKKIIKKQFRAFADFKDVIVL